MYHKTNSTVEIWDGLILKKIFATSHTSKLLRWFKGDPITYRRTDLLWCIAIIWKKKCKSVCNVRQCLIKMDCKTNLNMQSISHLWCRTITPGLSGYKFRWKQLKKCLAGFMKARFKNFTPYYIEMNLKNG